MLLCVISTDKSQCQHVAACVRVYVFACCVCLARGRSGGLLHKCIWGYVSPILLWCAGFQGAMIIHCVKTNLRKIRGTDCIQGNRIEAALTVFHPPRHDNMIFGLLHYRKCQPGPVGKQQVHGMEAGWVSRIYALCLSDFLTNELSPGTTVMLIAGFEVSRTDVFQMLRKRGINAHNLC